MVNLLYEWLSGTATKPGNVFKDEEENLSEDEFEEEDTETILRAVENSALEHGPNCN